MARTKKIVDYFPHIIKNGKTITILENKFGNDGYAFWFKLLEILGSTEGHYYEYKNTSEREFLHARTSVSEKDAQQILDLLADLGAIDDKLWEENIIWSDNFIDNIKDAYSRRKVNVPHKPTVNREDVNIKDESSGTMGDKKQQSKVKESKVKESKKTNVSDSKSEDDPPKYPEDSKPYKFALKLQNLIRENNEYIKLPDKSVEGLQNWANSIRKLNEYGESASDDGKSFSYDKIDKLIEFSQDDEFWRKNILSAGKLRKQASKLTMEMKDDNGSGKSKGKRRHSTMTDEEREELGL